MTGPAINPDSMAFHETVETPEQVQLQLELAGLGTRSMAFVLDALIRYGVLVSLVVVIMLMFSLSRQDFMNADSEIGGHILVISMILLFFAAEWIYYTVFEWHWNGQTPGKRAVHIRVLKDGGGPISFLDSALRNLMRPIDSTGPMCAIGILFIFFSRKNKRPGDFAARTIVVRERTQMLSQILAGAAPTVVATGPLADQVRRITITAEEHEMIARYLQRRPQLDIFTRQNLSRQIALVIVERIRAESPINDVIQPAPTETERFLEALLSAQQRPPG
jgi:uncharacterized RDD family membrane protein YckC